MQRGGLVVVFEDFVRTHTRLGIDLHGLTTDGDYIS